MSFFSNAQNFKISGGEFLNVSVNSSHHHSPTGIDILLDASVPDAAVDAEVRSYASSCFPGTRTQYINDITSWATTLQDGQSFPIYWMRGPAGVGKSAVAQTCAEKIKDAGQLGAAFFFSINGRNDHTRFFTTLAYQLSTNLPDYRHVLNDIILGDKTLITKTMSSQFSSLIVEPLKILQERGRGVGRKTIVIDGLDECRSRDAQYEIVKIIGASAMAETTPFRWAIFSRPEAHIVAAFDDDTISPLCRLVELHISRKADEEIELYLRGEFKNILRRRALPVSSSWPTDESIQKLVDASAGLFAYPATVLRFIDHYPSLRLEETLSEVLGAISTRGPHRSLSPLTELDTFYKLILRRIPEEILPSVQLLLSHIVLVDSSNGLGSWRVARLCNALGLSETEFRGIYQQLHAVIQYQGPSQLSVLTPDIDPARPFNDQIRPLSSTALIEPALGIHGSIYFHHKSFYEFLLDPTRSSTFCVTTPVVRERLLERLIQSHNHYSERYAIKGSELILAPGVPNSSSSLSWPHGNEFIDSFLKFRVFLSLSYWLSHDGPELIKFLENVPKHCLHKLVDLNYRKSLIGNMMDWKLWGGPGVSVLGFFGYAMITPRTLYASLHPQYFRHFDSVAFLQMVALLKGSAAIKPFHPRLPSNLAPMYQSLTRQKPKGKSHGQYKMGRGDRSVIWYWEFDTNRQYFHEFQTVDFVEAMKVYKDEKFDMWEKQDDDDDDNLDSEDDVERQHQNSGSEIGI